MLSWMEILKNKLTQQGPLVNLPKGLVLVNLFFGFGGFNKTVLQNFLYGFSVKVG